MSIRKSFFIISKNSFGSIARTRKQIWTTIKPWWISSSQGRYNFSKRFSTLRMRLRSWWAGLKQLILIVTNITSSSSNLFHERTTKLSSLLLICMPPKNTRRNRKYQSLSLNSNSFRCNNVRSKRSQPSRIFKWTLSYVQSSRWKPSIRSVWDIYRNRLRS